MDCAIPRAAGVAKLKGAEDAAALRFTQTDDLEAMLRDYNVPIGGLEVHINNAIRARNDIIHKGTTKAAFPEFYLHVAVLREVLKRIIVTLLKYKGQYISFLNGQEFLEFPPPTTTTIK